MPAARIARIAEILAAHRIMAIATNRPDGYPQTTIVGYANDGLLIYMVVSPESQKRQNLARDSRVSIAIGDDAPEPTRIAALSLAGRAHELRDAAQIKRAFGLLLERYPEYIQLPQPGPSDIAVFEIRPEIVSILDYAKGFGHTDLVAITQSDWRAVLAERAAAEAAKLPT